MKETLTLIHHVFFLMRWGFFETMIICQFDNTFKVYFLPWSLFPKDKKAKCLAPQIEKRERVGGKQKHEKKKKKPHQLEQQNFSLYYLLWWQWIKLRQFYNQVKYFLSPNCRSGFMLGARGTKANETRPHCHHSRMSHFRHFFLCYI